MNLKTENKGHLLTNGGQGVGDGQGSFNGRVLINGKLVTPEYGRLF